MRSAWVVLRRGGCRRRQVGFSESFRFPSRAKFATDGHIVAGRVLASHLSCQRSDTFPGMTRDLDCDERLLRRSEPGKRDRIIEVTLDLIVEHGVAGATYRTVAEAAGVPLGSMTHRFTSRESRLLSAFTRFMDERFSPLGHRYTELSRQGMLRARSAIRACVPGPHAGVLDAVQDGPGVHRHFLPEDLSKATAREPLQTLIDSSLQRTN